MGNVLSNSTFSSGYNPDDNNLKTYTSVDQIIPAGFDKTNVDLMVIYDYMPDNSVLIFEPSAGSGFYPAPGITEVMDTIVTIKKGVGFAECTSVDPDTGKILYSTIKSGSGFSPWSKLYGEHNKPTPADIGALASTGTAAAATKLATARTIRTNLGSTSTASFNGTENITPGVTGTLPVANGGTGVTSLTNLLKAMFPSTATPTYVPVFGSNWESRGYANVASLLSSTSGMKMQLKTYTGTGTYGSSNPNSITFSFAPTIAIMLGLYNGSNALNVPKNGTNGENIMTSAMTTSYKSGFGFDWGNMTDDSYGKKSSDGKTFYWYNAKTAAEQCNTSGNTYYVLALG